LSFNAKNPTTFIRTEPYGPRCISALDVLTGLTGTSQS
jgi:hypothetical protein